MKKQLLLILLAPAMCFGQGKPKTDTTYTVPLSNLQAIDAIIGTPGTKLTDAQLLRLQVEWAALERKVTLRIDTVKVAPKGK